MKSLGTLLQLIIPFCTITCFGQSSFAGSNDFSKEIRNITAYKGGFFSLSHTGQLWEGTIFPVLKEEMVAWWQDPLNVNPVASSFFEVIYIGQDADLTTTCSNNLIYAEKEITVTYKYELKLKKGFNLIGYKIDSVQKSGLPDFPAIPSHVTITNAGDTSAILWHAKYYY